MGSASHQVPHFSGGEWSQAAQGRVDRPDYHTALNTCLNAIITEQGPWARRPGTVFGMTTRGGAQGRVISFDFKQAAPYLIEFTAGYMRFFSGTSPVLVSDTQAVSSLSTANPAVVEVPSAWASTTTVMFSGLGTNNPLLQNRQFTTTKIDATHMSLQDAVTGDNIDGSTLGTFVSGNISRIYEIASPYVGTLWQTLRAVPADIPTSNATTPGAVLLHGNIKPYVLQVTAAPTATTPATFSLTPAVFKDGPYFDPVPGGTLATPSAVQGNVTITLSFATYDATKSYSIGDYVTSANINYKSLTDANVGNTPASSPSNWVAVNSADAIGPNGFTGADIGRHVRLFSEPSIWDSGATYSAGAVVAYGGSGNRYTGATYWKSLVNSNTGNVPGIDLTKWALFANGALWTWGRITGLSNIIDRALAGSANFGNMIAGGGIAAAFDGVFTKINSLSAANVYVGSGSPGNVIALTSYAGKDYSLATAQKISQAVVYPSSDLGFGSASINTGDYTVNIVFNLRAKNSAPSSSADGTLLATKTTLNTLQPITLISSDQTTAYSYVWVEQITYLVIGNFAANFVLNNTIAQLSFFGPPGTGTSQGITVQIVGDAMLYTTAVRSWRLGVYSDTTGWPTCGTYHEGRLWLSGALPNRIDSSKANDIFNFAPTNADGSVSADNGISYTFNAPDINPILWMVPDYLGIVCGTQAGEWLVQATSQNLPLTPTSIQAHRVTTSQCANIEPKRTDLTLAVVQAYKRELLEYFADVFSGKFLAQDLAWAAKHITRTGIQEIAFQNELVSTLWSRMADGSFAGCTYKRDSLVSSAEPKMRAWHRHTLGSSRTVESIAMTATNDGTLPTLAMVTVDATGVRHVEMMTKMMEETDTLQAAWFLDDAVNPTSMTSSTTPIPNTAPYGGLTLNGLWHLNGQTVQVWAGGLDCGDQGEQQAFADFTVSSGSVFVPYGDGSQRGSGAGLFTAGFAAALSLSEIVVGFTYVSQGQTVRPGTSPETGARNGPPFGKLRRQHWYLLQTIISAGMKIGTSFDKLRAVVFKSKGQRTMQPLNTFTGIARDAMQDDYSLDSMIAWEVTRPYPAMVSSVGGFIETQDQ